jgi:hypothetical protein
MILIILIIFIILFFCFMFILLGLNEYFHGYRNKKVYELRKHILDHYPILWYDLLPSYHEMMYSLKPLKLEYWLKYIYDMRTIK